MLGFGYYTYSWGRSRVDLLTRNTLVSIPVILITGALTGIGRATR
jgi:hypothetical protein